MTDRSPLTELEQSIAKKYSEASFPPATAAKAFARNLGAGYTTQLSGKGRHFLAFCVHRYRRQYALTVEEQAWVDEWRAWTPPPVAPKEKPVKVKPVGTQVLSGKLFPNERNTDE